MKIRNMLSLLATLAIGSGLCAAAADASQLSVTSFPERVVISKGDNRTIALIAAKDGIRTPGISMQISVGGVGGSIDQTSCSTDDSGQCTLSFTAPDRTGESSVKALATLPGAESVEATVKIEVVEIPTLSGSGWQCDGDKAVFSQIQEMIPCQDACDIRQDCQNSKCLAGSDIYCHSAQEACDCSNIGTINTESDDSDAGKASRQGGSTLIYALAGATAVLALLAYRNYIAAKGDEDRFRKAKRYALLAVLAGGLTLIAYAIIQIFSKVTHN